MWQLHCVPPKFYEVTLDLKVKKMVTMVGREGLAPQVDVESNDAIIDVVSCFKCLGSCFSKEKGL